FLLAPRHFHGIFCAVGGRAKKNPNPVDRALNLKNERLVLLLLAAIQFTTNLDFLIILPLGPQYMRVMHISPAQFNMIVAAYAIAAGITGVAAGFFLDRFDRKTALLWLFVGFG